MLVCVPLTPHMFPICAHVMHLCMRSARLHATVTSRESKSLQIPKRRSDNKKYKKKEQQQQQSHQDYNSDDDTTTKAAWPASPGAAALADRSKPRARPHHISVYVPRGQKPSVYGLREAKPAHVSGRGVKLETGDGGEQDKGAAGPFMVTRPTVSHSLSFAGCSCKECV